MNYSITSLGILIILIGFALVFIGALTQAFTGKSDTKVAVGGFIGFIPFGLWNDKRLMWAIIGLTSLLATFWFITQLLFRNH